MTYEVWEQKVLSLRASIIAGSALVVRFCQWSTIEGHRCKSLDQLRWLGDLAITVRNDLAKALPLLKDLIGKIPPSLMTDMIAHTERARDLLSALIDFLGFMAQRVARAA